MQQVVDLISISVFRNNIASTKAFLMTPLINNKNQCIRITFCIIISEQKGVFKWLSWL